MAELEVYDENDPIQQRIEQVAKGLMKGHSELKIARDLGIKRVEVLRYADLWRKQLAADSDSRDMARDYLNQMVQNTNTLIFKANKILDELENLEFNDKIANQQVATLKAIHEFDRTRVDLLQKAGLLEGAELGDELAEMEKKQKILIDILRNDLCPECQKTVARRLQQVTNVVEAVVVHDSHDHDE